MPATKYSPGVRVPRLYPVTHGLELATGNNEWEMEVKLIFISHKPVLFTDGKGSSPTKSRLFMFLEEEGSYQTIVLISRTNQDATHQ
jgi:hypothetical protein